MEVLDLIIQKGYNRILMSPDMKIADTLKAIEMKNKITGGTHGGLTSYGLAQLKEIEQAKIDAIIQVVLKYLPEDKYDELQQAVSVAEQQFYEQQAPELIDDYEKATQDRLEENSSKKDSKIIHLD